MRPAPVVVGGKARTLDQMAGLQVHDAQPGRLDQAIDRAVQVTTARQTAPERRQAVLPVPHQRIGRLAMLDEQQAAARPQHAPDFRECLGRVGDAAQGPGHDHVVDRAVVERDVLGAPFAQLDRKVRPGDVPARHPQQLGRRVETEQQLEVARVEGQVEARPDADLEHATTGACDQSLAQLDQRPSPHGDVDQPGQNESTIDAQVAPVSRCRRLSLRRRRLLRYGYSALTIRAASKMRGRSMLELLPCCREHR